MRDYFLEVVNSLKGIDWALQTEDRVEGIIRSLNFGVFIDSYQSYVRIGVSNPLTDTSNQVALSHMILDDAKKEGMLESMILSAYSRTIQTIIWEDLREATSSRPLITALPYGVSSLEF